MNASSAVCNDGILRILPSLIDSKYVSDSNQRPGEKSGLEVDTQAEARPGTETDAQAKETLADKQAGSLTAAVPQTAGAGEAGVGQPTARPVGIPSADGGGVGVCGAGREYH